ncbi:ABC transporter ATP-binding protein [Brevibacillus daliensis]|uniref:ABC transporter ATP-binding protein n=1 Tax=Brevibacillus daliensis TaxID=2892995 RepID=UPI001E30902A|nr:ABC transporter ATP-binding protein [Brevibacillus daliensis]
MFPYHSHQMNPAWNYGPVLSVQNISHSFGAKQILHQLSLDVQSGDWIGIIGPNGSGKSTLLSLMSRAQAPSRGEIFLQGRAINSYKRKELSRHMAVLQQEALPPVSYTVREVVEMGRFPYQSFWGLEKEDSQVFIDGIMERLQLEDLHDRPMDQLSGGQRQRVALAKLMAQSPDIVLLDEPTTYLDIHYQVQFMEMVRSWQNDCGLTVISVLHDLNLAALYCNRLVVLEDGKLVAEGSPDEIMTQEQLEDVFQVNTVIVEHPEIERPQILVSPNLPTRKVK